MLRITVKERLTQSRNKSPFVQIDDRGNFHILRSDGTTVTISWEEAKAVILLDAPIGPHYRRAYFQRLEDEADNQFSAQR